jgi:hypothetical protein
MNIIVNIMVDQKTCSGHIGILRSRLPGFIQECRTCHSTNTTFDSIENMKGRGRLGYVTYWQFSDHLSSSQLLKEECHFPLFCLITGGIC